MHKWLRFGRIYLICFLLFNTVFLAAQAKVGISGTIEWDNMQINAVISLDLASAGIKLPGGRTQGEAIIAAEYLRLIRPDILNIQVDSSSVIADIIDQGNWTFNAVENIALQADAVPPALSNDLKLLSASYSLGIASLSSSLIRHEHTADIPRTLSPVRTSAYTGIIIMAYDEQPVHGRKGSAFPKPCLFPKIWDTEMNLIFERNMLNPKAKYMVRYFHKGSIFSSGPSGLSKELSAVVGENPLKIFAQGVFGINPTDPIISREDTLRIISSAENRSLLREGRIAIILDNSMLKETLGN
ncbi:MAG: polymerase [Treponema sp.]|nr:polymerase [Treponema sp.]